MTWENLSYLPLSGFIGLVVLLLLRTSRWRASLQKIFPTPPPKNRFAKNSFYLLGVSLCLVALLGPRWGQREQSVRSEGLDLCIALDLSQSMLAEDMGQSRLESAKNSLSMMFDGLSQDRVSLVGFAGSAFTVAPLTTDHTALVGFMQPLNPSFVSNTSTSLGSGVDACLETFGLSTEDEGAKEFSDDVSRLVLLVTDGEDRVDSFGDSITRAKDFGVVVSSMVMGTVEGAKIPLRNEKGTLRGFLKDRGNKEVVSKIQEKTLNQFAQDTGGKVYRASSGREVWQEFVASLESLKRSTREEQKKQDLEHRFQIFLGAALALLLLEVLLSEARRTKNLGTSKVLVVGFLSVLGVGREALAQEINKQARPDAVIKTWQARRANESGDREKADALMDQAVALDSKDPLLRYNWATQKLNSAIHPEDRKKNDKDKLTEANAELNKLSELSVSNLKEKIEHQLAQSFEQSENSQAALHHYYRSLRLGKVESDLNKSNTDNIIRLLIQQGQSQGGGGGSGEDENESKDGEEPQNSGAGNKKQEPEFSGTDVSEAEARRILESVSNEAQAVKERKTRDEARARAKKGRIQDSDAESGDDPW